MRDSFVLYTKYKKQIDLLNDKQSAQLLRAIFNYQCEESLPKMDSTTMVVFSMIKEQLDTDYQKYLKTCERNAKNIGKRWNTKNTSGTNGTRSYTKNTDNDSDSDNDSDNEIIVVNNNSNNQTKKNNKKEKRFQKPTLEEVQAYCIERKNSVNAQHFVDYYTANGWKVGRNEMKDWKAAVRTWERQALSVNGKSFVNNEQSNSGEYKRNSDGTIDIGGGYKLI